MDSITKKCMPCSRSEDPLKAAEIETYLSSVPNWQYHQCEGIDMLTRHLELKSFAAVIELVDKVADVAESQGHHPNLHIHSYKELDIEVYTHKIGGLHENDFILARQIEKLIED